MPQNAALIIRLDRDMFNSDLPGVEPELQRRLDVMLQQLYEVLVELAGTQVVNTNITYYAEAQPADPNISEPVAETGRTITVNGLDDLGKNVQLKFVTGRLQE